MSIESQDAALIREEVTSALLDATEQGLFLMFSQVRQLEDGRLVADVYDERGEVQATYELDIFIGARTDEDSSAED